MQVRTLFGGSGGYPSGVLASAASAGHWDRLILATSVAALLGLAAYRCRWSRASRPLSVRLQDSSFDRVKGRVAQVYAYVVGGCALTLGSAAIAHAQGLSLRILQSRNSYLGLALALTPLVPLFVAHGMSKEDSKLKHLAWSTFHVSMGLLLSPLGFVNKALLAQAGAITLAMGGACTLGVFLAPDLYFFKREGPLLAGLTGLSIASAAASFFPNTAFSYGVNRAMLYGGLGIFTCLFAVATRRLYQDARYLEDGQFDPIHHSMAIYLKLVNMAKLVLKLLAERGARSQGKG